MRSSEKNDYIVQVCMMIYNYWPEKLGGSENQCRKLVKLLTKEGIRCSVIAAKTSRGSKYCQYDNKSKIIRIPVFQLLLDFKRHKLKRENRIHYSKKNKRKKNSYILKWLNTLTFMLGASIYLWAKRKKIDIIHVHIADWIAGYAGFIGNLIKKPVICKGAFIPVFTTLGKDVPFSKTIDKWRRKIAYFALTEDMKSELIMKGVPKELIVVVPNLVEIPEKYADVEKNETVLYVGNLSQPLWHKAFDVLFNSWCIVHMKEPEARLVVVGSGNTEPWEKFLIERNAENSVQFEGFVHNVDEYYSNASVFVLPSRSEGISNALLEAQSWGIPAVVTNIPGNRAIVIDEVTGILVPVDDIEALSDGILRILRDPIERKKMGEEARKRINNTFSPNLILREIINTYQNLLINAKIG